MEKDNSNIEINEQPNENNNTTGIENIVVYKDNAKKTMKGKKTKLIVSIVAGVMLISVVGRELTIRSKKNKELTQYNYENAMYQNLVSNLLIVDETHRVNKYLPGEYIGNYRIFINEDDYNVEEFSSIDLYYKIFDREMIKRTDEGGYEPNIVEDSICIYDAMELSVEDLKLVFAEKNGYKYFPQNGCYVYKVVTNRTILIVEEIDENTGEIIYNPANLGFAESIVTTSDQITFPRN